MLEKATLRKCMDFAEGPYDFLLVSENIPAVTAPPRYRLRSSARKKVH